MVNIGIGMALIYKMVKKYKDGCSHILGLGIGVNLKKGGVVSFFLKYLRPLIWQTLEKVELYGKEESIWRPRLAEILGEGEIPDFQGSHSGFYRIILDDAEDARKFQGQAGSPRCSSIKLTIKFLCVPSDMPKVPTSLICFYTKSFRPLTIHTPVLQECNQSMLNHIIIFLSRTELRNSSFYKYLNHPIFRDVDKLSDEDHLNLIIDLESWEAPKRMEDVFAYKFAGYDPLNRPTAHWVVKSIVAKSPEENQSQQAVFVVDAKRVSKGILHFS
ncbi:unnamed protein product, partial [Allacma fusca]